jgi:hypothetical protein
METRFEVLTVWRLNRGHIVVVGVTTRPESGSRWTAERDGTVVIGIRGALADNVMLQSFHMLDRVHMAGHTASATGKL